MLKQMLKEASDALNCDWDDGQKYNVVDSIWFNNIGIVKVETNGVTNYYIGSGKGLSQVQDEQYIAAWGSKFDIEQIKHRFMN